MKSTKRLAFLAKFFIIIGASRKEVAEKIGLTTYAISHWFINDDMFIHHLQGICAAYGYTVSLTFDNCCSSSNPGNCVLAALDEALSRLGVTHARLAELMNVKTSRIDYLLRSGRVRLSQLIDIANSAGLHIRLDIYPCTAGNVRVQKQSDGLRFITNIASQKFTFDI